MAAILTCETFEQLIRYLKFKIRKLVLTSGTHFSIRSSTSDNEKLRMNISMVKKIVSERS